MDRDSTFAQSVSHEVRAQQADREEFRLKDLKEAEGRKLEVTHDTYEYYAGPVQATFDDVIANSLSLLRGFTLDERANRIKEHFKVTDVSKIWCIIQ